MYQKTMYTKAKRAKRFSNPRKESTPCDGDGKRKQLNLGTDRTSQLKLFWGTTTSDYEN